MNSPIEVPFADLYSQYTSLKSEIDYVIESVIRDSAFVRGKHVEDFEQNFARLTHSKYCVSCANGTDSLLLAMKALGIKPGDEVIVPAHTWISTSETVTLAGGRVVFADTEKDTYTISISDIKAKITPKTVGIIPVHLFGNPAEIDSICEIANKHNLWVIEDCAQAHLATYKGKPVGSFGNVASYSFYPGKNLGAMGDAGAVTSNDQSLASKIAMFARHGGLKKGDHQIEGMNSRLDGMQAAILNVKLKRIEDWTLRRRRLAKKYKELLCSTSSVTLPVTQKHGDHSWHLFVIKVKNRDEFKLKMKSVGIQTLINYPVALPFVPAYKYLNLTNDDYPNSFFNQSRILSLPLYPEMSDEQQLYVAEQVLKLLPSS